jgi:hypothetical protein
VSERELLADNPSLKGTQQNLGLDWLLGYRKVPKIIVAELFGLALRVGAQVLIVSG